MLTVVLTVVIVVGVVLGVVKEIRDPRPVVVTTRPSVMRVLIGGLLLGPVGAIAGYAAKKKQRTRIDV